MRVHLAIFGGLVAKFWVRAPVIACRLVGKVAWLYKCKVAVFSAWCSISGVVVLKGDGGGW